MDGFHLANVALAALGRAERKGAIDTFDGAGYAALLTRLRDGGPDTVWAPTYDRSIEESVAGAIGVPAGTDVVVTEGNYLLVDDGPWSAVRRLLDEVWVVQVAPEVRTARLVARHVEFGKPPERAAAWVATVDDPNAAFVRSTFARADLVIDGSLTSPAAAYDAGRVGGEVRVARGPRRPRRQPRRRRPHERLLGRRGHLRGRAHRGADGRRAARPGCRAVPEGARTAPGGPRWPARGAPAWTTRPTSRGSPRCAAGSRRAPSTRSTSAASWSTTCPKDARLSDLGSRLAAGNPAPYAATIDLPEAGLEVACASPEAYLVRRGDRVTSRPIKGTAPTSAELLPKDYAENVMIVDLVRHDLGHVSLPGTVEVDHLCRVEEHPGLVHLVSDVSGTAAARHELARPARRELPARVGQRRPEAHRAARRSPTSSRCRAGPYCGAVGWVDADRDEAELAVGIRTFWAARDDAGRRVLRFGTGAGHHLGERRRGGVARDRAQGGASRGARHGWRGPGMRGCDA